MARHWSGRALEASRSARDVGVLEAERYALIGLASAELHLGHADAASRFLDELEPLLDVTPYARNRYLNHYQLLRGELALSKVDATQTLHWAAKARTLAEAKGMRKNIARSWLLGGRAHLSGGHFDVAIAEFQRGLDIADSAQNAALGWQGRVWLAQALAAHRSHEAHDMYVEASTHIDVIAAGLTPREVEVLKLVAGGATNATIARLLSISPRTVDVHMTSILNKSEIQSPIHSINSS
jgi:ATP/maltotriose-dependent transcriptional regulator MalT